MKMHKKIILFVSAVFSFLCLVSCRATPPSGVIVNKSDFEENLMNSTEPPTDVKEFAEQLPEHVSDELAKNGVTVNVDADVVCGVDYGAIPVYKFQKHTFSQEKLEQWVKYFAGDNRLYGWPTVYTKSYYEKEIIRAKQGTEVDGELVVNEEWVKHLEQLYAEAPEGNGRIYVEPKLVTTDEGTRFEIAQFSAAVETGENDFSIFATNGTFYCDKGMSIITDDIKRIEKCSITTEQARPVADKVIEDLGIKNMKLVKSDRAVMESFKNQFGISSNRPEIAGIQLTYMREEGGVAADANIEDILNAVTSSSSDDDYSPTLFVEKIKIFVSNDGEVESFKYNGMLEEDYALSEGVTLTEFDEIVDRGMDYLYFRSSTLGAAKAEKNIKIDSISLVMTYIKAKDDVSAVLLVPAWRFSGKQYYTENGVTTEQDISATINAIDGSRA